MKSKSINTFLSSDDIDQTKLFDWYADLYADGSLLMLIGILIDKLTDAD